MATPHLEDIAAAFATRIGTITEANGYEQDLNVIRPKRVDFRGTWNDLDTLISQAEAEPAESQLSGVKVWWQAFLIVVLCVDSDDASTSIDTRLNAIAADIEKCIHADVKLTVDSAAMVKRMEVVERNFFDADVGGPGGVSVKVNVLYAKSYTDPYTKG